MYSEIKLKNRISTHTMIVPLVLSAIIIILFMNNESQLLTTVFVLLAVIFAGYAIIANTAKRLNDNKIKMLNYFFLFKILLIIFLLYVAWIPFLDQSSIFYGYDPQRYYFDAQMLALHNFNSSYLPPINYSGIIYYYAVIFKVFGHNPVIPALLNSLISLYAVTLIMRVGYSIKAIRGKRDWMLGLAIVIPEIVWFDAITSRETLVMSLMVISVLSVTSVLLKNVALPKWQFLLAIPCMGLIGIVRTPMLIPCMLSIVLFYFIYKTGFQKKLVGLIIIIVTVMVFIVAPYLSKTTSQFSYTETISSNLVSQGDLQQFNWQENSIGKMIIADNLIEVILFAPIRLVFYIVAPLPSIKLNLSSWSGWQNLGATLSAFLYIGIFPHALASLFHAMKRNRSYLIFHIPFWIIFLSIVVGNNIIHDRYRIMAIPLLWACVWLSMNDNTVKKRKYFLIWYAVLGIGAITYLAIKL